MNYTLRKWSLVAVTVLGTFFLYFSPLWGSEWTVSPQIALREEYDDNILFSKPGSELDDYVTYITPSVEAAYRTQRLDLSLNSGLGIERYINNDELDTVDQAYRVDLSYAVSPILSLRTGGYFRRDTTLETELSEEGLLVNREDRRDFGGNVGLRYAFSTRVFLSGAWSARYTEYPDDPSDYDDRQTDTLNLDPEYILSRKSTLFLRTAYTRTSYDRQDDPSIDNYSISPSFRYDFSERSYVSGGAGYRYTETNTDEHTDGLIFSFSFYRNWKKASMELVARRNQYSSTGLRSIERNRLAVTGTYRLSARFSTGIVATFGTNREDRPEGRFGQKTDYYSIKPTFSYNLTPTIEMTGSANYYGYNYEEDIPDKERFRASLLLGVRWPQLWTGR